MNVNSLNSISAMKTVSNAPAFKGCGCDMGTKKTAVEANLSGLDAIGNIGKALVHTSTISFDPTGKKVAVSSDVSINLESQRVELDRKEGQSAREIIKSFIDGSKDFDTCSAQLKDGSVATVSRTDEGFETTLTKDGESEVIHNYCPGDGKADIEAFKDFALMSLGSLNQSQNPIESVSVSTQK